jgi:methyltransferase (TIGR00027 family)
MRDDTASRTAAWVAATRHLGLLLPDGVRLVEDRFGAAFTSRWIASLIDEAAATEPTDAPLDQALRRLRGPLAALPWLRGWIAYMQVRTHLIDEAIRELVAAGGASAQLVLLGAGYDCRALRIAELAGLRVFEVDHPATQRSKRRTLESIGARSPATYVAWDFERQPLAALPSALAAAGHLPSAPTFTVWEGVTMYLSEAAIDASLRAIAAYSSAGSRLGLTYFAKRRLARPSLAVRAVRALVATVGEPWRFGWEPAELPRYLAARGLVLERDVAIGAAARDLLPAELASEVGDEARRVAIASAAESFAVARRG